MEMWFKRILERNDPPMESDEGCLVTAAPEDIFSLIKTQAELASEYLKDEVLCRVIKVLFEGISSSIDMYRSYSNIHRILSKAYYRRYLRLY